VSFVPDARAQVGIQVVDGSADVIGTEGGEDGDPGTNGRVEAGVGTAPERTVEPVGAVMRDGRGNQPHWPQ
jgi:hypothetical protein